MAGERMCNGSIGKQCRVFALGGQGMGQGNLCLAKACGVLEAADFFQA